MKSKTIRSFLFFVGIVSFIGCLFFGLFELGNNESIAGLVIWILAGLLVFALLSVIGSVVAALEEKNQISAETNTILKEINENLAEIRNDLKTKKKEE